MIVWFVNYVYGKGYQCSKRSVLLKISCFARRDLCTNHGGTRVTAVRDSLDLKLYHETYYLWISVFFFGRIELFYRRNRPTHLYIYIYILFRVHGVYICENSCRWHPPASKFIVKNHVVSPQNAILPMWVWMTLEISLEICIERLHLPCLHVNEVHLWAVAISRTKNFGAAKLR